MALNFLKRPREEGADTQSAQQQESTQQAHTFKRRIGEEQVQRATKILQQYMSGKANLESRLVASEQWWKMRHWDWMDTKGNPDDPRMPSAWLFNTIINKHADGIQSYPQPNIRPREESDKETAKTLSAIIPCVLEQNEFEETYSDVLWQKLKQGTGVYGVFWDGGKLNGLGDISIRKVDVLNLFWEPGVSDIQKSEHVFHVELVDNERLVQMYPELDGKLKSNVIKPRKYIHDDNAPTENKSSVVDWYYHTYYGGKKLLQYCKFVGTHVIYASENDTEVPMIEQPVMGVDPMTGQPMETMQQVPAGKSVAETGWYAHGQFPFVFDRLFPVEGTPCGFGYIDVCKSTQEQIDLLNQGITINALMGSRPRYFVRTDGGVNEQEFCDWRKPLVHVNGNLAEDALRQIDMDYIDSNYVAIMNNKITEMKETTGNTDASNGVTNGVTSASGIAAQQEASGKTSKAATMSAYRAFGRLIDQVIELIRQFYDVPRMFRITGQMGEEEFRAFDNSGMQPQAQGTDFGMDMGYRLPVFDVEVSAQSKTIYTQNSQNELAVSLYNLGVFNPQNVDQALMLLDTMDFDGKEELAAKVSKAGTIYQMFAQVSQIALALAQQYDPAAAEMLAQIIMQRAGGAGMPEMPGAGAGQGAADAGSTGAQDAVQGRKGNGEEIKQVRDARARANSAAEVR